MNDDARPPAQREVDAFLAEVARRPPVARGERGRILFGLDATASRQPTWDLASHLQSRMFDAAATVGSLELKLCFFRGFREFRASDWKPDGASLRDAMTRVRCAAGHTQIERLLRHAIDETRRQRIQAMVYVGDCIEEDADRLCGLAGELGLLGTPLFVFHEGDDAGAAAVFRQMAKASGGAFASFDAGAAERLAELLGAVAVYAAGGRPALEALAKRTPAIAGLLAELK
ncbi:MAG TPA: VWA domain-containing protein [Pseudomonadales bacterium]|nr:VWA domain-containing protein [Pseudomonadales bacterium]